MAAQDRCCHTPAFLDCSPVGVTSCGGALVAHCSGSSCCRAQALGCADVSIVARGLCSCGTQAQVVRGMWDLLRPRIESLSPALAGVFFTAEPPGKPSAVCFHSFLSAVAHAPFSLDYSFQALHPVPSYFTFQVQLNCFLCEAFPNSTASLRYLSSVLLLHSVCFWFLSSYNAPWFSVSDIQSVLNKYCCLCTLFFLSSPIILFSL